MYNRKVPLSRVLMRSHSELSEVKSIIYAVDFSMDTEGMVSV